MPKELANCPVPLLVMPGVKMELKTASDFIGELQKLPYRRDREGQLYLQISEQGKLQWEKIDSTKVHRFLSSMFYTKWNKYVPAREMKEYLETLAFIVTPTGPDLEHFNRIATFEDKIVIDLHDGTGRAIEVTEEGWNVQLNNDILFLNYSHMEALPVPVEGNGLDEFFDFYQVEGRHQRALLGSWLVASLFANFHRAHLGIVGPSGFGKTSLAVGLKNLIDPIEGSNLLQRNQYEMAQVINHQAIPMIDNLTAITPDISELFCVAHSRGRLTTRVKYTNDGDHHVKLYKGIILTSKKFDCMAADLTDRTVFIVRPKKMPNFDNFLISSTYNEMHPRVLGTILSAASQTMRLLKGFNPTGSVRVADYHRIGLIASDVLGYGADTFDDAIRNNKRTKQEFEALSNPVVNALLVIMKNTPVIKVYMKDLLDEIRNVADASDEIPNQPNQLSKRVK